MIDKMKNILNILTSLFLIPIIVVSIFIIINQSNQIKALNKNLPTLNQGDKIKYFDLIGVDKEKIDVSVLNNQKISLIFIFSQPCSPCNKNIPYWKKLANIFSETSNIYGIILGDIPGIANFSNSMKFKFKLFCPMDLYKFREKFRLKLNLNQTIICKNEKVIYIKEGDLEPIDYFRIYKIIKGEIK
jgi:peroxiredoxin